MEKTDDPELATLAAATGSRDPEDPVESAPYASERRLRGLVGLPDHGPHAIRLLVEARGLRLEALRSAVRRELEGPA